MLPHMKHFLLFLLISASTNLFGADLSSFNGTWIADSAEFNGNSVEADNLSSIVLAIKDGSYHFKSANSDARGTFKMDFTQSPPTMDSTEAEGSNVGRTLRAIAELNANGWRACYASRDGGERPKEFKTAADSGQFLIAYKRKPGTEPSISPLKVLLLAGGCCHEYGKQKDVLKAGIEARANAHVDIIYSPDTSTHPPLSTYGNPDYAQGYDVVIHDECSADISDPAVVEAVLKPHRDGIPGVNLHCAMHSYRIGKPNEAAKPGTPHAFWFDYLGLQSSGHGPQKPIAITFLQSDHPITKGLQNWTTINEELYNNIMIWGGAQPLARGRQDGGGRIGQTDTVVVWANEYGAKRTRVFSTTLGHNTQTVGDARYLDLVTRGLLWSTKHLNEDGTPATGYGPGGK
ncbi:MAG: TIGR03067 domain-containing protein [Pedosphaera sp.]|nr:TIGR03067 domain-containing protein [Pedosphaera sp.]